MQRPWGRNKPSMFEEQAKRKWAGAESSRERYQEMVTRVMGARWEATLMILTFTLRGMGLPPLDRGGPQSNLSSNKFTLPAVLRTDH